jgi:hypothetical protein
MMLMLQESCILDEDFYPRCFNMHPGASPRSAAAAAAKTVPASRVVAGEAGGCAVREAFAAFPFGFLEICQRISSIVLHL